MKTQTNIHDEISDRKEKTELKRKVIEESSCVIIHY